MTSNRLNEKTVHTFVCPPDRGQIFLWDSKIKGLGVRATPGGKNAYIFQGRTHKKTVRVTIGRTDELSLEEARLKACDVRGQLANPGNPENVDRLGDSVHQVRQMETVGQLWSRYLKEGTPRGGRAFSSRYLNELRWMAAPGGETKKRGHGIRRQGPLNSLMPAVLKDLDENRLLRWYTEEAALSNAQAGRALMMFRGFLRWCLTQPVPNTPSPHLLKSARSLAQSSPMSRRLTSAIPLADLADWWAAVIRLPNKKVSIALRILVTTGFPSQAVLNLKWRASLLSWWDSASFQCHHYTGHHMKLSGDCVRLFRTLSKESGFVFPDDGKPGHIPDPRWSFKTTLEAIGLEPMPLSALRRTFLSLSEAAGVPYEAVTQYTGVSATGSRTKYRHLGSEELMNHVCNLESELRRIVGRDSLL